VKRLSGAASGEQQGAAGVGGAGQVRAREQVCAQQFGEGLGDRCGRVAQAQVQFPVDGQDVVQGQPDDAGDGLGEQQDQHGDDPVHQGQLVVGHKSGDDLQALGLADWGEVVAGFQQRQVDAGQVAVGLAPAQERA
jgi:hypothetical protein